MYTFDRMFTFVIHTLLFMCTLGQLYTWLYVHFWSYIQCE